jgi:hypothetical protein
MSNRTCPLCGEEANIHTSFTPLYSFIRCDSCNISTESREEEYNYDSFYEWPDTAHDFVRDLKILKDNLTTLVRNSAALKEINLPDSISKFYQLVEFQKLYEKHERLYGLMSQKLNNIDSLVTQFASMPAKLQGFERLAEYDEMIAGFDRKQEEFKGWLSGRGDEFIQSIVDKVIYDINDRIKLSIEIDD